MPCNDLLTYLPHPNPCFALWVLLRWVRSITEKTPFFEEWRLFGLWTDQLRSVVVPVIAESIYRKYRIDIDISYRIAGRNIKIFNISRYQISIYHFAEFSFIHSRLDLTVFHWVSVSEGVVWWNQSDTVYLRNALLCGHSQLLLTKSCWWTKLWMFLNISYYTTTKPCLWYLCPLLKTVKWNTNQHWANITFAINRKNCHSFPLEFN